MSGSSEESARGAEGRPPFDDSAQKRPMFSRIHVTHNKKPQVTCEPRRRPDFVPRRVRVMCSDASCRVLRWRARLFPRVQASTPPSSQLRADLSEQRGHDSRKEQQQQQQPVQPRIAARSCRIFADCQGGKKRQETPRDVCVLQGCVLYLSRILTKPFQLGKRR